MLWVVDLWQPRNRSRNSKLLADGVGVLFRATVVEAHAGLHAIHRGHEFHFNTDFHTGRARVVLF